jgi:uncharacterized YigZ family protein
MSVLHTLTSTETLLQDIKKSRFLAQTAPIDDPANALAFVSQVGDPLATHNCWAYRIGQQYRFSDDGEPGGTAGRPILQAIEGQGFDRIVVVVTRWYGGIKLGAGGLARAYGGCAAECLRLAERTPIIDMVDIRVSFDFSILATLQARLRDYSAEKIDERFDAQGVQLHMRLPRDRFDAFSEHFRDLTRGRGTIEASRAP